ncbi:DUF1336 domain-containing protein [bacterium]|nr:DUF1336 domain-containing protein [bacterium]
MNTVLITLITLHGSTRSLNITWQDKHSKSTRSSPRNTQHSTSRTTRTQTTKQSKHQKRKYRLARCPSISVVEGLDNTTPRPSSLNKNFWSICNAQDFKVRGAHYASDGVKINSLSSMFEVAGVDLFKCKKKVDNISSFVTLPIPKDEKAKEALRQSKAKDATPWHKTKDGIPFYFVVNIEFPDYDPPMLYDRTDGIGYSLVIYFTRKQDVDWSSKNNAASLLRKFAHSSLDGSSRKTMKGRFKCICQVAKLDELEDVGMILRNTLKKFNGKPFLAAPMQRYYEGQDYLEVDVDVHEFTWAARKGVRSVRDMIKDFEVDLGFLVEGRGDEECPERLLGAVRVSKLNPDNAKWLDALYELPKEHRVNWDRDD